jgi:FixJ family two-component response regulator
VQAVDLGKTTDPHGAMIWVVDPDAAVRGLVKRLLERHGHSVVTCERSSDFLSKYRRGGAGCLILECDLEDGSGLGLQRELAAGGDLLPLVFLAANPDVPTAVSALKAGATDFLLKPVEPAELVRAVQGALARARRYRTVQEAAAVGRRLQLLTAREREVLELVIAGHSTKQISARLGRVAKTVEFHRQNIMRKLGATNVAHLVRLVTAADHAVAQRQGSAQFDGVRTTHTIAGRS